MPIIKRKARKDHAKDVQARTLKTTLVGCDVLAHRIGTVEIRQRKVKTAAEMNASKSRGTGRD